MQQIYRKRAMPKCNLNKVANPIMFSSVFRGHQVETLTRNELKAFMQLVFTSYKLEKQKTNFFRFYSRKLQTFYCCFSAEVVKVYSHVFFLAFALYSEQNPFHTHIICQSNSLRMASDRCFRFH